MTIIFDFDGTIADSFDDFVDIVKKLVGYDGVVAKKQIEKFRGMEAHRVVRELKIPLYKLPVLAAKGRKMMVHSLDKVTIFSGIKETIKELKKSGHNLILLSTNSKENIAKFLKTNGIDECFDDIYFSTSLLSKTLSLKKVIRIRKIKPIDAVFIGDESKDILAARANKLRSVAVTWGYNTKTLLESKKPSAIASEPSQIIKIIKSWDN